MPVRNRAIDPQMASLGLNTPGAGSLYCPRRPGHAMGRTRGDGCTHDRLHRDGFWKQVST